LYGFEGLDFGAAAFDEKSTKVLGTDAFLNAESGIDAKFEAVFGASWVPLLLPVNKGY